MSLNMYATMSLSNTSCVQANRILLEKMTMYAKYSGAKHLRPWACRSTVNYKAGMVYNHGTNGLHIDHLNIPANPGTPAGGNRKTVYMRKKVLTIAAYFRLSFRGEQ